MSQHSMVTTEFVLPPKGSLVCDQPEMFFSKFFHRIYSMTLLPGHTVTVRYLQNHHREHFTHPILARASGDFIFHHHGGGYDMAGSKGTAASKGMVVIYQ